MCGILGILQKKNQFDAKTFEHMLSLMDHRGPDDSGIYSDKSILLGHKRLSILDLSQQGKQPMWDTNKRYIITYNGEVYNFLQIRKELTNKGYTFVSNTDTEVIVNAYAEWGAEAIKKLEGMFAFAIWDTKKQKLFLARDRYGIKPLYVYENENYFIFSSEIKSILESTPSKWKLDYEGIYEYLTFQSLLSEKTFFQGINLFDPGTYQLVGEKKIRFWEYNYKTNKKLTKEECLQKVSYYLQRSIKKQIISDVPVSSYLSSGVDSSTIAALIKKNGISDLNTFTMGFEDTHLQGYEKRFNESADALKISQVLQTNHTIHTIAVQDVPKLIKDFTYYSEDGRHGFMFQGFALAQVVSQKNKVVLAGVGGDEIHGGYPWRYIHILGTNGWKEDYFKWWQRVIKLHDFEKAYTAELRKNIDKKHVNTVFTSHFETHTQEQSVEDKINKALNFEARTFLHSLLVVEDKLSMAWSLETRVPFLDNEFVDFCLQIPVEYKISKIEDWKKIPKEKLSELKNTYIVSTEGKEILRNVVADYIPKSIATGEKKGYTLPLGEWFRNELKGYVEDTLLGDEAFTHRFVNKEYISEILDAHMKGNEKRLTIWALLFLEEWGKHYARYLHE